MKRYILLIIFLLFGACHISLAQADQKEMKPVFAVAVLQNITDFQDYVFIQLETLGSDVLVKEVVGKKGRISKTDPHSLLEILALPRNLYEQNSEINEIDLVDNPQVFRSMLPSIESGLIPIAAGSDVGGKEVLYYIESFENGKILFKKTGENIYKEHPNYVAPDVLFWGFLVTFLVEMIIFMLLKFFVLRSIEPRFFRVFFAVLFARLATLPVLWFTLSNYSQIFSVGMLEIQLVAVLVETIIYRYFARISWRRAALAAAICTLCSYAALLLF